MRWEVTRRHGYYQIYWNSARNFYRNEPPTLSVDCLEFYLGQIALHVLMAIGVSGEPPDPAIEFANLDPDHPNHVWLYAAVQPLTLRALSGLCLRHLPKDTLGFLGMIFLEAACDDEVNQPPRILQSLEKLVRREDAELNSYPDAPFVAINPAASSRQIQAALQALLPQWRNERNLNEQRDRSDKYEDYLRVWDLREGWQEGRYDNANERLFREVAAELQVNRATVISHYRKAFELIVGHPYSPEMWFRVFGLLKLSGFVEQAGSVSRRRPSASPVRRPIPESALQSSAINPEMPGIASAQSVPSNVDGMVLYMDIIGLLGSGRTDEQIVRELDLSPRGLALIAEIRKRQSDD